MALFVANDRVWILSEDRWWPAKIYPVHEASLRGLELPQGMDYIIQFYDEDGSFGFAVEADLEPFELSSEKAVTMAPDLAAAIRRAKSDPEANPIKTLALVGGVKRGGDASTRAVDRTHARGEKRGRTEAAAAPQGAPEMAGEDDEGGINNYPQSLKGYRTLDNSVLMDIRDKLTAAVEASDARAVRKQLLRLERVEVLLDQLLKTRIGVAVGSVLSNPALSGEWALARAFINWFANALPRKTLQALQYYHDLSAEELRTASLSAAAVGGAPSVGGVVGGELRSLTVPSHSTTATGPAAVAPVTASSSASAIGAPLASSSSTSTVRNAAIDRLVEAFALHEAPTIQSLGPSFQLRPFVESLFLSLTTEKRRLFAIQISKPGHSALRQQLLRGELDGEGFSRLTNAELITREEVELREARIQEQIAKEERLKAENSVGTDLFPCPNCKKRNAMFHEQQVRGADEPTTKFITCLECKHHWTSD